MVARLLIVAMLLSLLAGCGINNIPTYDEQVKAAWSQVQNQYQRRADLIPNLVETVKGYAAQEKNVLTAVTEARSRVASMQVSSDIINDPQKLKAFQQAQDKLTGALSRLMVVVERYPDLKSQLEGTENRISVARRDYIQAVQRYNTELRTYPGRIWYKMLYSNMKLHANYEATTEDAEKPPAVKF